MDSAESKLGLAGEVGKAPPCPVERVPGRLEARALVLCDHASNAIPPEFGALGLPPEQLKRHIAYDIGACLLYTSDAADE